MCAVIEHGRVLSYLDAREPRRDGLALSLMAFPVGGDEPTSKLVS
jgi:hypothetical protein